jgi:hypothetical protein
LSEGAQPWPPFERVFQNDVVEVPQQGFPVALAVGCLGEQRLRRNSSAEVEGVARLLDVDECPWNGFAPRVHDADDQVAHAVASDAGVRRRPPGVVVRLAPVQVPPDVGGARLGADAVVF